MGVFSAIGDSFVKVFTNPSKANFGQFATVVTSVVGAPFVNSTIAAPFAALAIPFAGSAPVAAPAAATTVLTAPGLDLAVPGLTTAAGITPTVGGVVGASSADAATVALTGGVSGGGAAAGGGFWAAVKEGGGFIKSAAEVSAAAKGILTPWVSTARQIRDAVEGGPGIQTRAVPVSAGGGNFASAPRASAPSSSAQILPVVAFGSLAVAIGYYLVTHVLKASSRHA